MKELLATSAALAAFLEATAASYAIEFTDNMVAEGAARRAAPASPPLQRLVERRVELLRRMNAFTELARVGTHENLWADLISREGGLSIFLAQVADLGLTARRLAVDAAWRDTSGLGAGAEDPELGGGASQKADGGAAAVCPPMSSGGQ